MIKDFRGPATFTEAENSSRARVIGFFRPRPPRRGGRANTSLSESVGAGLPVKAGINSILRVCSSGWGNNSMFGVVLSK